LLHSPVHRHCQYLFKRKHPDLPVIRNDLFGMPVNTSDFVDAISPIIRNDLFLMVVNVFDLINACFLFLKINLIVHRTPNGIESGVGETTLKLMGEIKLKRGSVMICEIHIEMFAAC
jgi:hypothetical protein